MLPFEEMHEFANMYKHATLKRQTVITCLDKLHKCMADEDAVSCLVLGSENKDIYILDPEAFTVLSVVCSLPVKLGVSL